MKGQENESIYIAPGRCLRLYGCKKVVHMHGEVGKEIIIGHNGTKDYTEENPSTPIGCYNSFFSSDKILITHDASILNIPTIFT